MGIFFCSKELLQQTILHITYLGYCQRNRKGIIFLPYIVTNEEWGIGLLSQHALYFPLPPSVSPSALSHKK
jgi:hypothetical protein